MRINIKSGIGFDVHAFATGRQLVVGGVDIPHEKGLEGHSDADVLAHAITDALTGPALGKDIGGLFPDTDPVYKNADSLKLLERAVKTIRQNEWEIGNIDATIIAQTPKMAPHIPLMRERIAAAVGISPEDVSIKATTTEYLGFTGRKEGIAALATVLIYNNTGGNI